MSASTIPLTQPVRSESECTECHWWNEWGCNNTNWMSSWSEADPDPRKPVCDRLGFREKK